MMDFRIETIAPKLLAGKYAQLSLANNTTRELWRSFMQQRKEITNAVGTALYSMQLYDTTYFAHFNPANTFEKWAAIEVTRAEGLPAGIDAITLPGGLYAVFLYKGAASAGAKAFQYIFGTWLPASDYELDNRPHFELLGDKYKNDDPSSEEEIWIPIRVKK